MSGSGASASTPVEPQADERPWTPGPLFVVEDDDGAFNVHTRDAGGELDEFVATFMEEADATLYAAAPCLAVAARKLLNEVIGMSNAYGEEIRGVVGNTNLNVLKQRADELEAALRKATTGDSTGAKPKAEPPQ